MALLKHHLRPKWCQKRHDEGLKSDLGSSRGGQAVSESLNASILKRCSSLVVLFWVLLHVVFARKVLCIMVAASHCNCFSQCVKRGRGSAAGAAEDHTTCMLDALQSWDYTHDGCTVSNIELLETCLEQRSCS